MRGILLQIGYFEKKLSKRFKKVNFFRTASHMYVTHIYLYVMRMSLVCTCMSFVRHLYVLVYHLYVTRMYSFVICMSLVYTRTSLVCHLYVLPACYSYVTRMLSVYQSYALVCHLYVTRMYSYVIHVSLVCTRMSSVCHSYVLVCHPYVNRMWFCHEPYYLRVYCFYMK